MARVRLIHVSDLHLGSGAFADPRIVTRALIDDAKNQQDADGRAVDVIVFSGDLANSADSPDHLQKGFDEFLMPLCEALDVPIERLCVAPGNHDISREVARSQRLLERGLKGALETADSINHFFDSRADSSEFGEALRRAELFNAVAGTYLAPWRRSALFSVQTFDVDNCSVGVACLNSAWRATGESDDVDKGHLIIGERMLDEAIDEIGNCGLKVVVHHHPLDWLHPADEASVRPRLTRCFDLACVGHLHSAFPTGTHSPHGALVVSQAASVFQGRSRINGYQVVTVDTDLWQFDFRLRRYVDQRRSFDAAVEVAPNGEFRLSTLQTKDANCSQSELFLRHKRDDIDAIVENHMDMVDIRAEGCRAAELFVPPVLSKRIHEPAVRSNETVSFEDVDVDTLVASGEDAIVVGPRQSGKTSLALHIVQRIASGMAGDQRIPVYADFKHLKLNVYGLRGAVGSFYGTSPPSFDVSTALREGAFTFILDNFDGQSRENLLKFAKLLKAFPKLRWICLGSPDPTAVVKERVFREILPKFVRFHMRELPRRQIRQLTNRWVERGGLVGDPKDLFRSVMDQLAKGGLPRTPYMVTLLLWSLRRRQNNERLNEAVLLGLVVDYLLGKADFRQSRLGSLDPTAKEIILQQIALWLREHEDSLPENDLTERLSSFLQRKRSPFVAGDVLEKLIETGLLKRAAGNVHFKYECFQEYFIALAMRANMKLFDALLQDLRYLNFTREIELLAGLRRMNDDIIGVLQEELLRRAPDDFVDTNIADFDDFARKEMSFAIDAERLREIKKTRLTDEQVDEIMDEADRRALERGEEKVTESLSRSDGDVGAAIRRRQRQAIESDQGLKAKKVRPGTFIAAVELLSRVVKYSEFSDYEVKAPVTRYIIDGWVKIFLRVLHELGEIVGAMGTKDNPLSPDERDTIVYIMGGHLFNVLASSLNEMLSSPSSASVAHELLEDGEAGLGRQLYTRFLLEDANHPNWHRLWSDLLEDASTRGFVMQRFVQRLWEIAHSKSLDVDQAAQVEAVVSSIEKRLDLTKNQKGRLLQDLRDATTIASFVDGTE